MASFGTNPNFGELALRGFLDGVRMRQQATQFAQTLALQRAQFEAQKQQFADRLGVDVEALDIERLQAESLDALRRQGQIPQLEAETERIRAGVPGVEAESEAARLRQQALEAFVGKGTFELPGGLSVDTLDALVAPGLLQTAISGVASNQNARLGLSGVLAGVEQREREFSDPLTRLGAFGDIARTGATIDYYRAYTDLLRRNQTGAGDVPTTTNPAVLLNSINEQIRLLKQTNPELLKDLDLK